MMIEQPALRWLFYSPYQTKMMPIIERERPMHKALEQYNCFDFTNPSLTRQDSALCRAVLLEPDSLTTDGLILNFLLRFLA